MNERINELIELATNESGFNPTVFADVLIRNCEFILRQEADASRRESMTGMESTAVERATYLTEAIDIINRHFRD